ncbi:MAG: condensation domain-containing protein, partial [Gammaproteobacteria bacterium]
MSRVPANPADLVTMLAQQGIRLWADAGRLRYSAPTGALTPALREQLQGNKQSLLNHLQGTGLASGLPPLQSADARQTYPLSFAQQSLWLLDQMYPDDSSANEQFSLKIAGPVDVPHLQRAWHELLKRNPVFRARFVLDGDAPGQLADPPQFVPLAVENLTDVSYASARQRLQHVAAEEVNTVFDLQRGGLLRARLFHLSVNEYVLLVT